MSFNTEFFAMLGVIFVVMGIVLIVIGLLVFIDNYAKEKINRQYCKWNLENRLDELEKRVETMERFIIYKQQKPVN